MDNFRFVKCPTCGWEKNPRMSCFNCGDKAPAISKTSSDTAFAASEVRIAELEETLFRIENAMWTHMEQALDRIAALEEGLRSFARHYAERGTVNTGIVSYPQDDNAVTTEQDGVRFGDLRRAAALLKEKE